MSQETWRKLLRVMKNLFSVAVDNTIETVKQLHLGPGLRRKDSRVLYNYSGEITESKLVSRRPRQTKFQWP